MSRTHGAGRQRQERGATGGDGAGAAESGPADLQTMMSAGGNQAMVQLSEGPNASTPDGGATDGNASYPAPDQNNGEMCEPPREGSATVLGESGDTEYGFTNRGTPDIVQLLQSNPTASVDEVLQTLSDRQFAVNYQSDPDFPQSGLHPSIARYGNQPAPANQSSAQGKRGVLVANAQYTNINPLPQVTAQATSLQSELNGRGFATDLVNNANSATMTARYDALVANAQPGEELVGFFTGHGSTAGMCGINHSGAAPDMYLHGAVAQLLSTATARGAHIRFIIDACNSGAAATTVREERANQLDRRTQGISQAAWMALARSAMTLKRQLTAHSDARRAALRQVTQAQRQLQANPIQPPAVHNAVLSSLQTTHTLVARAYDQKIDQVWRDARPLLTAAAVALNALRGTSLQAPAQITDYARLGGAIDFLDEVANAAMEPVEEEQPPS